MIYVIEHLLWYFWPVKNVPNFPDLNTVLFGAILTTTSDGKQLGITRVHVVFSFRYNDLVNFSLNDELFENREITMVIIGRLVIHNPAYIMPSLRKLLIKLLAELEYSGVRFDIF